MPRHLVIYQYIFDSFSDPSSERLATTLLTSMILQYIDARSSLADHSTAATSTLLCLGAHLYYVADTHRGRWPASTSTYGSSCVDCIGANEVHHHNIRLARVRGNRALSSSLKFLALVAEIG